MTNDELWMRLKWHINRAAAMVLGLILALSITPNEPDWKTAVKVLAMAATVFIFLLLQTRDETINLPGNGIRE